MAAQQVYAQLSAVEAPSQAEVQAFYDANKERLQGAQNQVITLQSYMNRAWPWPGLRLSISGRRKRASLCANVCVLRLQLRSRTEAPYSVSPNAGDLRFGNVPSFSPLVGNWAGAATCCVSDAGQHPQRINELQRRNMTFHAWHEACSSLYKGALRRPGNRAVLGSRPW